MHRRLPLALILFASVFWRFFNYTSRWTLSQDQARDAIIGLYAISQKTVPLLGPPSSAGPFSFGPLYYWLIELFTIVIPINPFGPWVGFTILSVAAVFFLYAFGRNLIGKEFGFILGAIAAFAALDVFNAPDMLNPMLIGFAVSVALFSLQQIVDQQRIFYSVFFGLAVGLAVNFHLQSLGLVSLLLLSLFSKNFTFKGRIKIFAGILVGLFLAFIPLIYFDFLHKGAWSLSVIQYITAGQNKFNLPSSWLVDLRDFWPKLWGEVIVNRPMAGYLFLLLLIVSLFLTFKNKAKIPQSVKIIFLSFLMQIVLIHYYKGPRMPVYLIVYHPYFIFFTAWSVWIIAKYYKILGAVIFLSVLILAGFADWQIVHQSSQASLIQSIKQDLDKSGKGGFRIYSFESSFNISLPLFYLLKKEGKISENGRKIGVCDHFINRTADLKGYIENCPVGDNMLFERGQYRIFNLDEGTNQVAADKLFEVEPQKLYNWLFSNY